MGQHRDCDDDRNDARIHAFIFHSKFRATSATEYFTTNSTRTRKLCSHNSFFFLRSMLDKYTWYIKFLTIVSYTDVIITFRLLFKETLFIVPLTNFWFNLW